MPSHQARREPLPKGYQFGDALFFYSLNGHIALLPCAPDTITMRYKALMLPARVSPWAALDLDEQ